MSEPADIAAPGLLEACPGFDAIPGWLTIDEADYLFRAAGRARGVVVEIGSANGRSTIALSAGARLGANAVYAIEPHETFAGIYGGQFGPENRRHFFETMLLHRGWENTRLINLSSEIVAPGWRLPVGFLWIDGDHRYEAVRRDFDAWLPHLLDGATVAFHDARDPGIGPHRVVAEAVASGAFAFDAAVGEIVALRPVAGHTAPG